MSPPRWRPLPSLAGLDARIRGVSHPARGVYLLLICASDVNGVVRFSGAVTDAVDAIAGPDAGACVTELESFELIELSDDELVLPDVPRWQAEHAPRASQPAAYTPPEQPRRESGDGEPMDRRTASRRLHARWTRRGLKAPEARIRWLSSETGKAYLEESGIPLGLATAIASGDATPPATLSATPTPPGGAESATLGATPPATLPSPSHSPSGNQSRAEQNKPLQPAGARSATHPPPGGATPSSTPGPFGGGGGGSSSSDTEMLFELSRGSEGRFSTSGSVDQQEAVASLVRQSGVSTEALLSALRNPAEALPGVEMVSSRNLVSVAMLAGKRGADGAFPCTLGHSLVAYVRAQAAPEITTSTVPNAEETAELARQQRELRRRVDEERSRNGGIKVPAFRSSIAGEVTRG